jgi:membrane protein required for colicin V production
LTFAAVFRIQIAGRQDVMNSFDVVVYGLLIVAVVTGFNAGFLRSLATILGYLAAMPFAVATTPLVSPALPASSTATWAQGSLAFFAVFLLAGVVLSALMRRALDAAVGPSVGLADRLVGSLFGAIRIALIAVSVVLIFDRLIPADREPAFLSGSHLRPLLSLAGQRGLKSLPPDVTAFVDRLQSDRRP